MTIDGFLTGTHDGRFIFSKYLPELRLMSGARYLAAYPGAGPRGQGDPWWFAPNDSLCRAAIEAQGIEPPKPLESIPVTWEFRVREVGESRK